MKLVEQPNSGIAQSVVDAPEGTRPTYECVRDRHVNAVKLDVTYTADKVVVMSHDTNLKRTTGQNLPIIGTNYADFAAVKAQMGLWKEELDLYGFNLPSHSKYTTPELIRALKAEGSWLTVWYVHTTIIADTFANSGVDGFVTGAASAIRDYLKAKATKP